MRVGIHQLHYLPWLRYIHKIAASDVFVVLDNIQFNKNGHQNRNKIKGPQGVQLLSVPVIHQFAQNLDEVKIESRQKWQKKHWGSIQNAYRYAPYFQDYADFLEEVYTKPWGNLNDLNYELLGFFLKVLGVQTKVIKSQDLEMEGEASDRLLSICQSLGAKSYYTGAYAAQEYLEADKFAAANIAIEHQQFTCPEYSQQFSSQGFVGDLSILDLLMNCGEESLEILMNQPVSTEASS